jgi:predicted porin
MNNLNVWQVGAQATYMGFTLGAVYYQGDYNFFWGNTVRGDRQAQTLNVGASYTSGPFTFGSNMVTGVYEGGARSDFDAGTGRLVRQANPTAYGDRNNLASQRRWGMSVGANYRLAPGLDLIAEYVYHSVRENGRDLDTARAGVQSRGFANVFIMGSRLAF